jgi:DNA-directed RNA polymerase specialized sigma24 family protein
MPADADADTPEPDLLARARAGDALAFERLVKPQRRRLHVHCHRMLGSPHDADDAVRETLLAAWRGIASFEGRSALGTWLYQISTRVCLVRGLGSGLAIRHRHRHRHRVVLPTRLGRRVVSPRTG